MSHLLKHAFKSGRGAAILVRQRGRTLVFCRHASQGSHMDVPITEERPLELTPTKTKVKKEPFVKNLFVGKFDKSMLVYPEVLNNERLKELESMADAVRKYFDENVDTPKIDREKQIPPEVLEGFKSLGLFGLQVPSDYGGLDLTATEYARICEVTGRDGSIGVTLAAHNSIGLKAILLCGNEEQKAKYLPKLATGEHIAAFCLTEPSSGSDAASIQMTATLSSDKKFYHLNGSKIYISNGGIADVMTVFAKVKVDMPDRKKEGVVTAFIVERGFGGVTSGPPEDKLGIRGSNTTSVFFDNTPVPVENVLLGVGDGFKIAMNVLNNGRFGMGAAIAGGLRDLISLTADYAVNRVQFEKPLSEFHMIKDKVSEMTAQLYAIESMVYVSSAILDVVEEPDCALECAIVKVFSSEAALNVVSECLQIHGGSGFMRSLPLEQYYRDMRILSIFEGTNEILRLFIALMGVQHTGRALGDLITKLRNPMAHPFLVLQKVWENRRDVADRPIMDLDLYTSLHPSLKAEADTLEYCVKRLKFCVEVCLERFGREIVEYQMVLSNLADMVIDIYAMSCVLARASRSYCIGLRNADHELDIATAFCHDAKRRIKLKEDEINDEVVGVVNMRKRDVANRVFKEKMYAAVHPLTKNY
uniref:Putative very-long-chain acyl-coa dehydrogenase n=1 Tax=Ixodes ricinus TaxID=34613 RepID=A0A0K8RMR8_IXORI